MKYTRQDHRTGSPDRPSNSFGNLHRRVSSSTRGDPVVGSWEGQDVKDQPFLNVGDDEWTRVPNEVFDIIMAHVTPAEFKVLMTVIRFTRGWQKDEDEITLDQLTRATGLTKQGVVNSIKGLAEIVTVGHTKGRHANRYGLNKQWYIPEEWINSQLSRKLVNSQPSRPLMVKPVDRSTVNSVDPPKKDTKKRKKPSNGLAIFSKTTAVHSDHKQFIEWWCTTYLERFNVPYLVTGQCAKTAQSLLKRYSLPRLKEIAQALLDSTDPFLINRGKTIPTLYSEWNRLEQHRVKPKPKDDIPEFLG